jgi:hypothetical protein
MAITFHFLHATSNYHITFERSTDQEAPYTAAGPLQTGIRWDLLNGRPFCDLKGPFGSFI